MLVRAVLAIHHPPLRRKVTEILDDLGLVVQAVSPDGGALLRLLGREGADVLVLSGVTGSRGASLLREIGALPEAPDIVVLTSEREPEQSARLLAAGARGVLHAELSQPVMRGALVPIVTSRRLRAERGLTAAGHGSPPRLSDFESNSPVMQSFLQVVRRVASSDAPLLILGETGVGKERLARALHAEGPHANGPFVAVNCGALPEALLESELFGHEEGAFTGATRSRRGMFEIAHGGTIFLDEIGDMALHLQVKLLRVLQEGEIQRVGGEHPLRVAVRVMSATNRDLEEDVAAGTFRRDLFYRLGVLTLYVPPLRQRAQDIAALARRAMEQVSARTGSSAMHLDPAALAALQSYPWPGNVRELINVMERAVILSDHARITLRELPVAVAQSAEVGGGSGDVTAVSPTPSGHERNDDAWLEQPLSEVRRAASERAERAYLAAQLARTRGRVGETARRAGITPRALHARMKLLGLRKEDFRRDEM
jgi:DNA-binding NtrC family response regulator